MFSDLLAPAAAAAAAAAAAFHMGGVVYNFVRHICPALPFVFVGRVPTNASLAKTALHQAGPPTWCSRDV